jgi:hypothetical protein
VRGLGQQNCIQSPAKNSPNVALGLCGVDVGVEWFFGHTLWDSNGGVHVVFGALMISYKNPITFLLGCQ